MTHIPLNAYLVKIERAEAANCSAYGHPKEDVRHFLMDCPSYTNEKWALYRHSKMRNLSLKFLLNKKKLIVPVAKPLADLNRKGQKGPGGPGGVRLNAGRADT